VDSASTAGAGWVTARVLRRRRMASSGLAVRRDTKQLSARAVVERRDRLRPGAATVDVRSVGYWLGRQRDTGRALWASVEDSLIVQGPARSGKTSRLLWPTVLAWDGPAVVTETRPDVFRQSAGARAERGPVWVWDPQGATGAPPLRW